MRTSWFRYSDFGKVSFRPAVEIRRRVSRGGSLYVSLAWLKAPHDNFATVTPTGYHTEEQERWLKEVQREKCVYDIRSRQFYWPRRLVDQLFKKHERIPKQGPGTNNP